MNYTDSFDRIFADKKRVMVVFSHPDDAEIYAGGTIARLVEQGIEVRVVKMTLGNRGSGQEQISESDLADTRKAEDMASMAVLGIKPENNVYLNINDGEVDNSLATIEKVVRQIREFKPDLIITHNPEDIVIRFDDDNHWFNHRDHRHTGQSVIDASYPYSRDLLFFPDHLKDAQMSSHHTLEFLLVDYYDHPETVAIEITENQAALRTRAIACHASQYNQEDAQSSTDFFTLLDSSGRRFERFRFFVVD